MKRKKNLTKLRGKQVHGMLLLQLLCTIVGNNNNFYVSRQAANVSVCVCLHSFIPHNSLVCYVLGSGLFLRFYAQASKRIFTHTGRWTWTAGNGVKRATDSSDAADDDDDDGNNSEIPVPVQSFSTLPPRL